MIGRPVAALALAAVCASACGSPWKTSGTPDVIRLPKLSEPGGLCITPDGSIWLVLTAPASILRIDPAPPHRIETIALAPASLPRDIAAGPDGMLWFVEEAANRVGRLQPQWPYTVVEYDVPTRCAPTRLTAGPDRAMWFLGSAMPVLGRIGVDSPNPVTEIATPGPVDGQWSGNYGWSIAAGEADSIWFTAIHGICFARAFQPERPIQCRLASRKPFDHAREVVRGPDGAAWATVFMEGLQRQDLETGGETHLLALGRQYFARLAADTRGRIWATGADGLWEIPLTAPEKAVIHPLSRGYRPGAVSVAPDGRVWFVDSAAETLNVFAP